MLSSKASCAFLVVVFGSAMFGQRRNGGGGGGNKTPTPSISVPTPGATLNTTPDIFLSGKVVLDEGVPITEPVAIQTMCNGQKHTETYTDTKGNFNFQFSSRTSTVMQGGFADGEATMRNGTSVSGDSRDYRSCQILAALPGFNSDLIDLASKFSGFSNTDVGKIILRRMGGVQGTTISASAAAAPEDASKAFNKGRDDQKKEKWDSAEKHFTEAVRIYPNYAPAWFELGRTQVLQNNNAAAQQSFEKAQKADPKFVSPYQAMAELAARQNRWADVAKYTDSVLAMNSSDFPQVWFLNAIANYNLHNPPVAEKSVRQGIQLDPQHRMPKMEYLLGLVLAQRHDYGEATAHMQRYLGMVNTPEEIAVAQKQLSKLVQLTASTKGETPAQPAVAAGAPK
jgi:tetratricopeptide (TPR) repeat protein